MSLKNNIFIGLFNLLIAYTACFAETKPLNAIIPLQSDTPSTYSLTNQHFVTPMTKSVRTDTEPTVRPAPVIATDAIKTVKENQTTTNNLRFVKVCSKSESNRKSNEKCIEAFKELQVQPFTALGLAKEYIRKRDKKEAICSPNIRTESKDDYLSCTTLDNSSFYEFHFNDTFETDDILLSRDTRLGIGAIYSAYYAAGKITQIGNEQINSKNPDRCKNIMGVTAGKFSFDVKYFDSKNTPITSGVVAPHCKLIQFVDAEPVNGLKHIVDTKTFKNLQTTLSLDFQAIMAQYTARQLYKYGQIQFDKFWCNYYSHTYQPIEALNADEYVTCYVQMGIENTTYKTLNGSTMSMPEPWYYIDANGKHQNTSAGAVDKVYRIDFLFDDLSESGKLTNAGSNAALQCVSKTDGVYDGKHCTGLTQTQCTDLGKEANIKVKWDNSTGCVLVDAATVDVIKRVEKVTGIVAAGAGLVVLTVVTGGAPLYIAVAVTAGVAGTALSVASEALTDVERRRTDAFNQKVSQCKDANCVRDAMSYFIDHIAGYADNLRDEEIVAADIILSDKLAQVTFSHDDDLVLYNAFLDSQKQDNGGLFNCLGHNTDKLQTTKCVFDSASLVLDFIPITKILTGKGAGGALFKAGKAGKLTKKLYKFERTVGVFNNKLNSMLGKAGFVAALDNELRVLKNSEKVMSNGIKARDLSNSASKYVNDNKS